VEPGAAVVKVIAASRVPPPSPPWRLPQASAAAGSKAGAQSIPPKALSISAGQPDPSGPGKLSSSTLTAGVEDDTTYDGAGHVLTSITDAGGLDLESDYHYDSSGRQTAEKDPAGVVTINVYDATSGKLDRSIADCTDTSAPAHWYDCTGTKGDDGTANQITAYTYYDSGQTQTTTSPTGSMTHYTYDDAGHVLTEIDDWVAVPDESDPTVNLTTTDTYDTAGRQITTTNPAGSLTRTVYCPASTILDTLGPEYV
jgi:YD repeat-containing protein